MAGRKKIGLFFSYNENWIGGTYYIYNLIEALKLLPADQQPHLTIIYNDEGDIEQIKTLNYPFIDFSGINSNTQFIKRGIRLMVRKIFKKEIFTPETATKFPKNHFDAIFPAPTWFNTVNTKKVIYWIADFQEAYYPHLFTDHDLNYRKIFHREIVKSGETVIFSSYDAMYDFERLYPDSKVKKRVLQFAVTHPIYGSIDFEELKKKYNLPGQYFFCPNQFWVHKNQKVVIEALGKLKHQCGKDVQVVFSGRTNDRRNENYFEELQALIKTSGVSENITILGFIDRREQLQIMKHALAVIQPSFFEGWSTVVEDVKAMNQNIIVSNLRVHREQLEAQAVYFDPASSDSLADAILHFTKMSVEFAYAANRLQFANKFLSIVNE